MTDSKKPSLDLKVETLSQTDQERVQALMALGATEKRARFIAQMREGDSDIINLVDTERVETTVS